jgi:hypothetical protein
MSVLRKRLQDQDIVEVVAVQCELLSALRPENHDSSPVGIEKNDIHPAPVLVPVVVAVFIFAITVVMIVSSPPSS